MDYIAIILGAMGYVMFFSYFVLILLNKFDNKFMHSILTDDIVNLLYRKRYSKTTFKKIKFILIFRIFYFTLGLTLILYSNINSVYKSLMPFVVIVLRCIGNNLIEKMLKKDYINFNEEL